MKKKFAFFLLIASVATTCFTFSGCESLSDVASRIPKELPGGISPSEGEMSSALKQALEIGTGKASEFLNQPGGYLNNARFKIPFPPDAARAADRLRQMGLGNLVDNFIERMNRGAEDAAAKAKPIFLDAIRSMTLTDVRNIVLGSDNAATQYFQNKTTSPLYQAFSPVINSSLQKFEVTKYWTDITTTYNRIPGVTKVETDLVRYATNKALDGLFLKVADEEKEIRTAISARTTDVLKKVFGWADMQKGR